MRVQNIINNNIINKTVIVNISRKNISFNKNIYQNNTDCFIGSKSNNIASSDDALCCLN